VTALALGVLLLVLLVLNEWHAKQPIMPLRLFASRERVGAYAARVLYLGGMMGFWFFTTQFLQGVLGYTPLQAGLAFLPTTIPNFASAIAVPKLTRRLGNGPLLAVGIASGVIGMLWLAQVSVESSYLFGVALPMILIGIGQGGVLGPLTIAGVSGVAPEDAGAASGLVNATHQLGGSLGLAVLVVVFASADAGVAVSQQVLAHRIATAFGAGAVLLALALALVLALIVPRPKSADARPRVPALSPADNR